MKVFRTISAAAALLLAASLLPAQTAEPSPQTAQSSPQTAEPLRLSLEEAIALGLANSSGVRSKALGVEQARLEVASARAGYYPNVSASAGWTHLFEQPDPTPFGYTTPTDPLSVSIEIGQVVSTFGRQRTGVSLAETGLRSAELELAEESRALSTQIQRAFYGYLLAREALEINGQTLANRQEALEVARRKYQAGVASDFEVLQAEADVESARPALIAADNRVRFALLTVKNLLRLPEDAQAAVDLVGELAVREVALDRPALLGRALEGRHDLAALRQAVRLAGLQEDLSRRAGLPTVSAFLGYAARSGVDATSGANRWWGEGSWDGNLTAGLTVSVPISAWFPWSRETAARGRSRLATEDLRLALESAESAIRLAVENALLSLEEQRQRLRSVEKNIELAERLYGSAREQYARGYISSLELRDAELRLSGARLSYIQTAYSWTLALIDLQDAVGVDRI